MLPWNGQYISGDGGLTITSFYHLPIWVNVLVMAFFYTLAIWVHEQQHMNTLQKAGVKITKHPLKWYKPLSFRITWEGELTAQQQGKVYAYAILVGLFIVIASLWFNTELGWVIIGLYVAGCLHDFKALHNLPRVKEDT